ncbi:terminase small subunit [Secundilactobacillus yichangensis]|uniref:terminase small subunit n=1 Tax=Secundilactobacillus yichangensis TaxID=2799580 RepID=UPI00194064CD|nr:terminase small subunit [Secundilactobacillus yichangensis]
MTKKADEAKADYLAGKSYKEIATQYGVSEGTVRAWKSRYKWDGSAPPKKGATKSATQQSDVATKTQHVAVQQLADNHELTDKRKLFCLYYIQRYNATWAYQKAYQVDWDTAHSGGARLLSKDSVKQALSKLKKQQSEDLYLTANDIMVEYVKQAFADIGDYVDFGTETEIVRDGWFKPVKDKVTGGYLTREKSYARLKDSKDADTSLVSEIHLGHDGAVVKLFDKQKAMKELLDRLPEPEATNDEGDTYLKAIRDGVKDLFSKKDGDSK